MKEKYRKDHGAWPQRAYGIVSLRHMDTEVKWLYGSVASIQLMRKRQDTAEEEICSVGNGNVQKEKEFNSQQFVGIIVLILTY